MTMTYSEQKRVNERNETKKRSLSHFIKSIFGAASSSYQLSGSKPPPLPNCSHRFGVLQTRAARVDTCAQGVVRSCYRGSDLHSYNHRTRSGSVVYEKSIHSFMHRREVHIVRSFSSFARAGYLLPSCLSFRILIQK